MKLPSFQPSALRPRLLLLGEDAGIESILKFAEWLLTRGEGNWKPLVLLGSEGAFSFRTRPSTILLPGMPDGTIACVAKLDEWGIPSRLASRADLPGCFDGTATELARAWLSMLDRSLLNEVEVLACGPDDSLDAAARLAQEFGLPTQLLAYND